MVKYIKTEDGYKNLKSLELSKFTNDLYGNQLILSLAGTPSGDEIEESNSDSRATYFDQYIGFNSEKLDNFDLRDTDFLCTLKLGNQTFTFSRDNTFLIDETADEYDLEYGSWNKEDWDFSDGASPLYCLEMDLYRSDEEPYYWLNVYGHVNDSVADSISFTYDIIEREPKKIPKEYLEITKLSDLDNDLYGCDEYVSLAQITDEQWEDKSGPCHYWHMKGKTSFTEVNVEYDFNSIFDLSQTDFLVTMKVGDETVKISASDFTVSNRSSTDFMGDYGFEQSDIHDESFDIDAALIKPVCQLWLRLYVLNDKMSVSIEAHTNNPNTFVTFDFIEKQTKKIPEDYLNLSNIQSAVDAAQTTADGKMDANNPIGTGSFSIGRKDGSPIGESSVAVGCNIVAPSKGDYVCGKFNLFNSNYKWIKHESFTFPVKYDDQVDFNPDIKNIDDIPINDDGTFIAPIVGTHTAVFGINSYTPCMISASTIGSTPNESEILILREYSFLSSQLEVDVYRVGSATDDYGNYSFIIGNGTSDTERSNAHTLDWNGNAWYSGNVYTGSTSGKNKDEGSKKLATEEYADNVAASKITAPATAAIGQTIRVSEVDNTGKPTAWEAVDLSSGDAWRLVANINLTEDVATIDITQDTEGNSFALREYLLIGFVKGAAENTKAGSVYADSLNKHDKIARVGYASQTVPMAGGKRAISFYGKVCGNRMRVIFGNHVDGSSECNAQMYTMIDAYDAAWPSREFDTIRKMTLSTNVAGYGAGTRLELWGVDA